MRKISSGIALFCFLFAPLLAYADGGSAPADEYFGRHKASVLEIRNRLDAMDAKQSSEMYDPDTVVVLDTLQDAILDWQGKYPEDPWLPRSFERLLRDYKRAGAITTQPAQQAFTTMQSAYPDAPETIETVATIYGGAAAPPLAVAAAPAVIVVQPSNREWSRAWIRFFRSRNIDPNSENW